MAILSSRHAYWAVGVVAIFIYSVTLPGDFTFDDTFAIASNHDVTSDAMPLRQLFNHDFWGQDIRSNQSHKSYRPITVLVFRWTRQLWCLLDWLLPGATAPIKALRTPADANDSTQKPRPEGLDPFPFHVLNILMHALASMMVLALANHLFAKLEAGPDSTPHGPSAASTASQLQANSSNSGPAAAAGGHGTSNGTGIHDSSKSKKHSPPQQQQQERDARGKYQRKAPSRPFAAASAAAGGGGWSWLQEALMWEQQQQLWMVGSSRAQAQAFICAVLFALHPIHVEAVAGIVGHAELLCVVLSIPSLLLYFMAADGRYAAAATAAAKGNAQAPSASAAAEALQHWLLVAAAIFLVLLAALSKEIGICMAGTMLVYDFILVQPKGRGQVKRQMVRLLLLMAVTVGYVKLRGFVAGDHLVRIYRKAENPIPFADSFFTRFLSTGHLHARYFWLLLFPLHLSADWSFNCIPLVESLRDPRNLATLGLYCTLAYWTLTAAPFSLAASRLRTCASIFRKGGGGNASASKGQGQKGQKVQQQQQQHGAGPSDNHQQEQVQKEEPVVGGSMSLWHARLRLVVVVGLLVGPFFPASNVLMYVGTFIGERLLYFPSVGYCWLLADLLGALLPASVGEDGAVPAASGGGSPAAAGTHEAAEQESGDAPDDGTRSRKPPSSSSGTARSVSKAKGAFLGLLLLLLLGGYSARAWLRCFDWLSEERLFVSALKVCPDSCKVRLNMGIVARRQQEWETALSHFRRAQEIEPGYCEPTYWIGVTMLNMRNAGEGMDKVRESVKCKYVAGEALKTLNQVYGVLHEAQPGVYGPLLDWGKVLVSPDVLRMAEGCSTIEDAAYLAAIKHKDKKLVDKVLKACIKGLKGYMAGKVVPGSLPAESSTYDATYGVDGAALMKCVRSRGPLYYSMAVNGPSSPELRKELYRYILDVQANPLCRTSGTRDPTAVGSPSAHQKLLHRVQSADPEDPWLQWEWAETLLALNPTNLKEASTHYQVSAALLMQLSSKLAAGNAVPKPYTHLDGVTALTAASASEAAVLPLMSLKNVTDDAELRCVTLQRICHIKLQVLMLQGVMEERKGVRDLPASAPQRSSAKKQELAAKAAARRCLTELQGDANCRQHALQMASLISKQENTGGAL